MNIDCQHTANRVSEDRSLLSIAVCGLQQAYSALTRAHDHDVDVAALEDMLAAARDAFLNHDDALEEFEADARGGRPNG